MKFKEMKRINVKVVRLMTMLEGNREGDEEKHFSSRKLSFVSFLPNEANKKKYWMCSTWSNLLRTVLNAFI